jgi:hypothetical protein
MSGQTASNAVHVDEVSEITLLKSTRPNTTVRNRVQCKQELIVAWLQEFFTNPGQLEGILPILQGKSDISLRLIDWFVTNYAKKNNISYILNQRQFLVYFHYKRELKAYSKRLFDPFCRRERISFQARGHEPFVTTVGQLNFFRWALEKDILTFIKANLEAIEKDMNTSMREHYGSTNSSNSSDPKSVNTIVESVDGVSGQVTVSTTSTSSLRRRRTELSKSALKKVNLHQCDIVVSFS